MMNAYEYDENIQADEVEDEVYKSNFALKSKLSSACDISIQYMDALNSLKLELEYLHRIELIGSKRWLELNAQMNKIKRWVGDVKYHYHWLKNMPEDLIKFPDIK